MAEKQFVARNGLVSRGTTTISGSLITTQPASFSGSLDVTGSLTSYTNNSNTTVTVSADGTNIGGLYVKTSKLISFRIGPNAVGINSNPDVSYTFYVAGNARISQGLKVNGALTGSNAVFTGAGTTSSTTALLIENANTSASLQVKDDGSVLAKSVQVSDTSGTYRTALSAYDNNEIAFYGSRWYHDGGTLSYFDGTLSLTGGTTTLSGNQAITITNVNGNAPTSYITLKGNGGNVAYSNRSRNIVKITTSWTVPSGSTNINCTGLNINPTLDYTDVGGSSIVRGLYYGPSITGLTGDHIAIQTVSGDVKIQGNSNVEITGSLIGQPVDITPITATASLDCSQGNFFDLTLSSSYELYLSASNIQAGQTMNLRITQPATSGSLTYGSEFKFPGGIPYEVSATGSVVDIVSFISFDSSTLYGTAIKNLS